MLFLVVCASSPYHNCLTSVSSGTVLAEGLLSEVSVHLSMTACLAGVFDSECWAVLAKPPRWKAVFYRQWVFVCVFGWGFFATAVRNLEGFVLKCICGNTALTWIRLGKLSSCKTNNCGTYSLQIDKIVVIMLHRCKEGSFVKKHFCACGKFYGAALSEYL